MVRKVIRVPMSTQEMLPYNKNILYGIGIVVSIFVIWYCIVLPVFRCIRETHTCWKWCCSKHSNSEEIDRFLN